MPLTSKYSSRANTNVVISRGNLALCVLAVEVRIKQATEPQIHIIHAIIPIENKQITFICIVLAASTKHRPTYYSNIC